MDFEDFTPGEQDGVKWSFAAVLRKMAAEARTGVLRVEGEGTVWELSLSQGTIRGVTLPGEGQRFLERLLVGMGFIEERSLQKALKRARKSGSTLDEILVRDHSLTHEAIQIVRMTDAREHILDLFARIGVMATFRKESPPLILDVPLQVGNLVEEAERRQKMIPLLRSRVSGPRSVFVRLPGSADEVLGRFTTVGQAPESPGGEEAAVITPNEQIVYYHVNGVRTVEELGLVTGLGIYEATLALYRLDGHGFIQLLEREGEGEKDGTPRVLGVVFGMFFSALMGAMVAGLIVGTMTLGIGRPVAQIHIVSFHSQSVTHFRIRTALRNHHLVHGAYPVLLRELVQRSLLHTDDLTAVAGMEWEYRAIDRAQRYDLKRAPGKLDPRP